MLNSSSSILPFLNALDNHVSNTAIADVTMSVNVVTFASFFWYFLVNAVVTPLTLAPARDIAPNGMLTGRPINVLNVATLDIPVATLNPLEQAFIATRRFNVLVYFHISPCTSLLVFTTLVTYFEFCLNDSRPEDPQELMGQLDIYYSSSFF